MAISIAFSRNLSHDLNYYMIISGPHLPLQISILHDIIIMIKSHHSDTGNFKHGFT